MSSPLRSRSALGFAPGERIAEGRGLSFRERGRTLVRYLEGARGGKGLPAIGRSTGDDRQRVLGIGPDTWLLIADEDARGSLEFDTAGFDVAVDQTHAWTRLSIAGANARLMLAKGCVLDLDPEQFPAGACAATGIARMRAVLWRPDDDMRYDLLVGRSYAYSLWEWLSEAALEFGCEEATT